MEDKSKELINEVVKFGIERGITPEDLKNVDKYLGYIEPKENNDIEK